MSEPDTLGYHLAMCKEIFGEESRATQFLIKKIKESPLGPDEPVVASEIQVVMLLSALHIGNPDDERKYRIDPA